MLIWSEEFTKEAKEQFKDGFNEAVRADKCSYSIPIGYWPFDRYSGFEVKGFNPTEWGENYWDEVKEDLFPNDTSCSFFEEKKKCENCEGYCPPKHPDSLGACRKHEFRSCSGDRERCYDFVDKHTYFLCKHYRGDGDGEYEFCVNENVTGRLCSMQSTCPHFEKAYVPQKTFYEYEEAEEYFNALIEEYLTN